MKPYLLIHLKKIFREEVVGEENYSNTRIATTPLIEHPEG